MVAKSEEEEEFLSLSCYEGYKYAFRIIKSFNPEIESITTYASYLKTQLKLCLEKSQNKYSNQSYNFFMGANWIMIVLRKKERVFDIVSLNALGVLGSVFVKSENQRTYIKDRLPSEILKEILVEVNDTNEYKMQF